ncbi:GNAT family N-acetyltransferase [Thalassiella azotivora]
MSPRITFRPLDLDSGGSTDAETLHAWVTHPKSAFWQMQDADLAEVRRQYGAIVVSDHQDAFIGLAHGRPAVLLERYDPARSELAGRYDHHVGDVGMHVLVAPTDEPVHGFTRAVFRAVMETLLADPAVQRVVVEPDVRNDAVHRLNAYAGFEVVGDVDLGHKTALLSTCTRAQYAASDAAVDAAAGAPPSAVTTGSGAPELLADVLADVAHLDEPHWSRANRRVVAKLVGELTHERLLEPEKDPAGDADRWLLTGRADDDGAVTTYRFTAERYALDHWRVDPDSIERRRGDETLPVDAVHAVLDLQDRLDLGPDVLPVYLEEVTSTVGALAYRYATARHTAAELARADFQTVEASMTEGHPCFVAGSGRLGLDAAEYRDLAPEAARGVRLLWVALRRDRSVFATASDVTYEALVDAELDVATREAFAARMRALGLSLDDYHLCPVHPWQWRSRVAVTFAAEVADRSIVPLGYGPDAYQAQQSIRTLLNRSRPERHYVKTALSVLNMGFVRGLSAEYMAVTPAINDWLAGVVERDEVLRGTGVTVLRELAAVGYRSERFTAAAPKGSPYRKMLAALWRESPVPALTGGERLVTMASLLHVDDDGTSLAGTLVRDSGLDPAEWVRRYLDAYLVPLLHLFHAHGTVLMPHGENVILVLEDSVVTRVVLKDVGEEVCVLDPATPLPDGVERVRADVPQELWVLSLLTDVVDCFLRFLGPVLERDGVLSADDFWRVVAGSAAAYEASQPQLADSFARHDLFAERFPLSCLNRLQLRNNRQMVDLADPTTAMRLVGELENPLARWSPRS